MSNALQTDNCKFASKDLGEVNPSAFQGIKSNIFFDRIKVHRYCAQRMHYTSNFQGITIK